MSLGTVSKAILFPVIAVVDVTSKKDGQNGGNQTTYVMSTIIQVVILIVAGWLAWDCNKNETPGTRVIITLLAVIFSGLYLLYYLVYRVLMGVTCDHASPLKALGKAIQQRV